jgi:protein-tyrosine-phosphatase
MIEEIGVGVPEHPDGVLTNGMIPDASICVTMGCLDSASCPPRLRPMEVIDWALRDPARLDNVEFFRVRDSMRDGIEKLIREIIAQKRAPPQSGSPHQNGGR